MSLRKHGQEESRLLNLRRLGSSRCFSSMRPISSAIEKALSRRLAQAQEDSRKEVETKAASLEESGVDAYLKATGKTSATVM